MRHVYIDYATRSIADLSRSEDGTWQLHRVNVPAKHRGQRVGSQLLDRILHDADAERAILWLLPVPSGGLTYAQLITWYTRRGFSWDGKPDHSRLVRHPQ